MIKKKIPKKERDAKDNLFKIYTEIFMRMAHYSYKDDRQPNISTKLMNLIYGLKEDSSIDQGYVLREHIENPRTENVFIAEACNMLFSKEEGIYVGKSPYGTPKSHYSRYLHKNRLIETKKIWCGVPVKNGKGKYFRHIRFYALKKDEVSKLFLRLWFEEFIFSYPIDRTNKVFPAITASIIRDQFFSSDYYIDNLPDDVRLVKNNLQKVKEFIEDKERFNPSIIYEQKITELLDNLDEIKKTLKSYDKKVLNLSKITKKDAERLYSFMTTPTTSPFKDGTKEHILKKLGIKPEKLIEEQT